eukprot:m.229486 g.229486  ORF g.229486 m.229486 type:complete len:193 (+) comp17755_c0_seq1:107-685(+)
MGGSRNFYTRALARAPMLTKACTAAVLNGLEEISAQWLQMRFQAKGDKKKRRFDLNKIVKMFLYGLLINGPLGHVLYAALARALQGHAGLTATLLQLLVSNAIIGPLQTLVYLTAMGYIKGLDTAGVAALLRARLWPLTLALWQYFPAIQLVVFRLLPEPLWLGTFNLIGLLFGIYVNYTSARSGPASQIQP